ncbi:MAG: hypothetical protein ACYS18_11995 [Planctomycetota bacterium]|jgi:hypothetical protein
MKRTTAALMALIGILLTGLHKVEANQQDLSDDTIVPGVRVGAVKPGMSKDDMLKKLGKPKRIYWGRNNYTLDNLPLWYRMNYRHVSFEIYDSVVLKIRVRGPSYKFANGLGVGDSEQRVKQAFGKDFLVFNEDLIYGDNKLVKGLIQYIQQSSCIKDIRSLAFLSFRKCFLPPQNGWFIANRLFF